MNLIAAGGASRVHRVLLTLVCAGSWTVHAAELPTAQPEAVGMSAQRLERINEVIAGHIADGTLSGAVTAVARRGKVVHFAAHGAFDPRSKRPMTQDALFRMASSSKPVTGVAVLMLMEEGKLRLSDPVSRFIPEFKEMKVAVPRNPQGGAASDPAQYDLVPAEREITIKDLLTHTAGLQTGFGPFPFPVERQPNDTLATYVPRLANAPLDFQPGTQWRYSAGAGIDTLGRIVEIASGMSLDQFLKQRIFEPLDMRSTFFNVPERERTRLLPLYRRNGNEWQEAPPMPLLGTPIYFSGAAGLTSSARDYLRFEQMLLNGGELDGHRLLSPKTVELMAMNHVGNLYRGMRGNEEGAGFGLSVYVTLDPARAPNWRNAGAFGWSGAYGTISWVDPEAELVAVLMTQQSSPLVQRDFHTAIMQAIVD